VPHQNVNPGLLLCRRCAPAGAQLTALRFDEGGLQLAAGTSSGLVGLWDLRQRAPLLLKDHMYGAAIRDIKFHNGGVSG
jgi:ribosome biogenesis protein ENP2